MKHQVLLIAIIIGIAGALPALAQECTDCHDSIDMNKYKASIHGREEMGCTDCHGDFEVTDDGHDTPPKVSCENCHDEEQMQFEHSVHGQATKKHKPLDCSNCHGNHYILSDKSDTKKMDRSSLIEMNKTCTDCHLSEKYSFSANQKAHVKAYYDSVHYRMIKESGMVYSATCVDCHGSHLIQSSGKSQSKTSRNAIPKTCGQCHKGIYDEYIKSVHGKQFEKGNSDAPVCTDCHADHKILSHHNPKSKIYKVNIPDTCLKCHADEKYIKKYGFSPFTRKNYGDSFHGSALKLGDLDVATCTSCHGKHLILSEDDPESSINRKNLEGTCRQCHKAKDPVRINTQGRIHAITAKEMHPVSKWIAIIYQIIIAGTLGVFGFYIATDLYRHFRMKK